MARSGGSVRSSGSVQRMDLDKYEADQAARRAERDRAKAGGHRLRTPKDGQPEVIDPASPWAIDDRLFPTGAGIEERLWFCVRYALLAPSSHNTQPWRFDVSARGAGAVTVWADRTRALPVCDPEDRELTISCGCATQLLVLAMRRFGLPGKVELLPDRTKPDLLARVTVTGTTPIEAPDLRLFEVIRQRRTTRDAFTNVKPPTSLIEQCVPLCTKLGATVLAVSDDHQRRSLAALIAEADMLQLGHKAFRRELAMWMHHNRTHSHDGVPGYAMGMSEVASIIAPLVVRTFDLGKGRAAHDEDLALRSPVLLLLGTEADDAKAWLSTGRALAALTLHLTAGGLCHSYLNQACELAPMRAHLRRLFPSVQWPQIVLRVGYGPRTAHTPRRGVDEVRKR
jgi:hypothetical protein